MLNLTWWRELCDLLVRISQEDVESILQAIFFHVSEHRKWILFPLQIIYFPTHWPKLTIEINGPILNFDITVLKVGVWALKPTFCPPQFRINKIKS